MGKLAPIIVASHQNQKFYFNPDYIALPADVREELRGIAGAAAEQSRGRFSIGFYEDGSVYWEASPEDVAGFDEIEARLVTNQWIDQKQALCNALTLWYRLYCTEEGQTIRKNILDLS